jgi:hypothetical protein
MTPREAPKTNSSLSFHIESVLLPSKSYEYSIESRLKQRTGSVISSCLQSGNSVEEIDSFATKADFYIPQQELESFYFSVCEHKLIDDNIMNKNDSSVVLNELEYHDFHSFHATHTPNADVDSVHVSMNSKSTILDELEVHPLTIRISRNDSGVTPCVPKSELPESPSIFNWLQGTLEGNLDENVDINRFEEIVDNVNKDVLKVDTVSLQSQSIPVTNIDPKVGSNGIVSLFKE